MEHLDNVKFRVSYNVIIYVIVLIFQIQQWCPLDCQENVHWLAVEAVQSKNGDVISERCQVASMIFSIHMIQLACQRTLRCYEQWARYKINIVIIITPGVTLVFYTTVCSTGYTAIEK